MSILSQIEKYFMHIKIVRQMRKLEIFSSIGYNRGMNNKNILVVISHPRKNSLNHAIKDSVISGLKQSAAQVRVQDLYDEGFNPVLHGLQENEKDSVTCAMQANIAWADGIVFVSPIWWANVPAMLKGYFDRVFTEGFSFYYNQAGMPVGMLGGKKALMLMTSDTPALIAKVAGTLLGARSVIKGVLKFSGLKESTFKVFDPVIKSTENKRKKWLQQAEDYGRRFAAPDSKLKQLKKKTVTFIQAMRLPLYSFVFTLILLGASMGASLVKGFDLKGFLIALFIGLAGHAAVSLSNEAVDEAADKVNGNRTMFNGGTGLLAEGKITRKILSRGWVISGLLSLSVPLFLVLQFGYHWLLLASAAVALFLGVGYSLPPFRFSRIGLGEVASFIAYGVPMMLIGFILQSGPTLDGVLSEPRFFLLSLPVSFTVFATLCLTQVPDTEADRSVGKRSISVMLGPGRVMIVTAVGHGICIGLFLLFVFMGYLPLKYGIAASLLPLATMVLVFMNTDAFKVPAGMVMINLMGLSVTSAVLCGIIPAIYYFNNPY